jgi:hypothetical protein
LAESVDTGFEGVIENVRGHDHSPSHPLARSPELGMIKLRHGSVAQEHGIEHACHRLRTESVPLGELFDHGLAGF